MADDFGVTLELVANRGFHGFFVFFAGASLPRHPKAPPLVRESGANLELIESAEQGQDDGKEQAKKAKDDEGDGAEEIGFFHKELVLFIGDGKGIFIPTSAAGKALAALRRRGAIAAGRRHGRNRGPVAFRHRVGSWAIYH